MIEERLTIQQVAEIMNVKEIIVRRWIWRRWLPAHKIGPKLIRIYRSDLEALRLAVKKAHSPLGNLNAQRPGVIAQSILYPSLSPVLYRS